MSLKKPSPRDHHDQINSLPTMSMFLKRMESDGLIKFDVPIGQKRPGIELTTKGHKFFEELFPEHASRVTKMVHSFAPQTLKDLEKIRRRVSSNP